MCYFVEINLPRQELEKRFGIPVKEDPRYMPGVFFSAFTFPYLPVIQCENPGIIQFFQWGLIPFWIKEEGKANSIKLSTFNAREETILEKPSYRHAVDKGRCLILAHGFFEYHTVQDKKIPFYIRRKDNLAFAFAGISDTWTNPSTGEILQTCSIVTTPANPLLAKIHNTKKRMPVILQEQYEKDWIDPNLTGKEAGKFLKPLPAEEMEAWSISRDIIKTPAFFTGTDILMQQDYKDTPSLW